MALYLGNQKVSLRSGQDPTFDYGFDSNGRLVFANKNATEINNFLNYDSSYSEILDLSNLNKMEKVAVNGTVDRKMEGLKGLLVSPNAPFTGSSPQINASYTGLNKSALVSLFESAPYNVGYTKVGNPTIVDGVASGFSNSDYGQLPAFTGFNSNFEFNVSFIQTTAGNCGLLAGVNWYLGGIVVNANKVGFSGRTTTTGVQFELYSTKNISLNTHYVANAKREGNTLTLKLYKNGVLEETVTGNLTGITFNLDFIGVSIGRAANGYLKGSIYLNETYIKVNGVPWFNGKPAMTKTCSIVGATGTADLTQEDKNIILNKGWSLTVQ